jgi:hypothetical protein
MPSPEVVCLFCNGEIGDGEESCSLDITAGWTDSTGTYWCHGGCLQSATHPEIPLYILSLRRDQAVYGSRPTDPE